VPESGKLSPEGKQKFVEWLNEKSKSAECPVCGTNQWNVGDDLLNLTPFTGGTLVVGGLSYPVAFISCGNCMYVRHFMAVPLGLVPDSGCPDAG
jgi:C4-type Zn-finger protein